MLLQRATALDPVTLLVRLRQAGDGSKRGVLDALTRSFDATDHAEWERDAVRALGHSAIDRPALLAEAMGELDFLTQRWIRVPRVAASLSSSFGFLLATLALRVGLAGLVGPLDDDRAFAVDGAILGALDVAVIGLVGAGVCVAVQYRARAIRSANLGAVDRLVEFLEGLAEHEGAPLAAVPPHASVASPQSSEAGSPPVV